MIPDSLNKILSLRGVEFDWNAKSQKPGHHSIGVIAQEVEKVFPSSVVENRDSGYKMVDYASLVAPLIQSIKEFYFQQRSSNEQIHQEIEKLRDENIQLRSLLSNLEKRLSSLEKKK